jgi:hypothetical protein
MFETVWFLNKSTDDDPDSRDHDGVVPPNQDVECGKEGD